MRVHFVSIILTMLAKMCRFRIRNLAVHQHCRRIAVGGYHDCYRRSLRVPSSLVLCVHAGHERDTGR
jgi:hypothetical protein